MRIDKAQLEKLINKPRAFRNASMGDRIPLRRTMIILGAEVPMNFETPRHYKKWLENRKNKNNEPIF